MTIVARTCTEIPRDGSGADQERAGCPLSDHRCAAAYVLLGDPGAGKTTCFMQERAQMGDSAELIPARDFVALEMASHPEWLSKMLFIDGLDEIRAGDDDPRTALDRVRAQLDRLGNPSFRLSCREADWLGQNDLTRLGALAPDGELRVLRLNPLTLENTGEIAESDPRVEDAARFLREVEDKGLLALLDNPQNLGLLIAAVGGGGDWPKSRRELFELACRQLVNESNDEHRHSDRERPSEVQLLEAAGRVCALLLLSGTAGVDISPAASGNGLSYQPVERLDPLPPGTSAGEDRLHARLRRLALSSRLFAAVDVDSSTAQHFAPAHRHIAEFLAARYLAQRIAAGLPAARVIAMITAGDGGVVTPHRGLSAWLAVHSKQARRELIDRDPIGVGLYGDIGGFSNDEKESLLDALIREGRQLDDIGYRNATVFGPLATPALETEFHAELTRPPLGEHEQFSVKFALRVLSRGSPMPALVAPVLAILYGTGWRQEVTWAALDAFVRQCGDRDSQVGKLKQVLADVQNGKLPDPDNELSATVLEELYPETIGPSEIWRHLARCQPTSLYGRHRVFWNRSLEERTADEEMATLFDGLVEQRPNLELGGTLLGDGRALAEKLLARALAATGNELSPQRLYAWLNGPAQNYTEFFELRSSEEAWESTSQVRSWLEAHPDAYKAALLEGLHHYNDEEDLGRGVLLAVEWLRHAQPPPDFGLWCLAQARGESSSRPDLARRLFAQARQRLEQGEKGLSQQLIDEAARKHPSLRPKPPDPAAANELREGSPRNKATRNSHLEQRRQREKEWLDAVRAEVPALEQNRGGPWLLFRLAKGWFQQSRSRPVPLLDWLRKELGDEDNLAAAAAVGLHGVIERDDVPDTDEILRLHGESRMHYLSMPFLASLQELESVDSRFADTLTERQKGQACAFYYSTLIGHDSHPNWYRQLVERSPELVANALLAVARTELRHGRENVSGLWDLAHDAGHAELARLVSLPLLRGFPVRCHARQLHNLIRLLWTALQRADRHELLAVIEKKLASKSMTVNQRVHWLAAGVIAAPDAYADRLAEFIGAKELRARQLARFLWSEHPNLFRPAELPPHALEALIRQSGAAFGVYELVDRPGNGQHNAQPESVLWRLPELIDCLAALPEPEAGTALHRLADDQTLHRWRYHLRQACDRQAAISRDSSYRRPELDQVRSTLDDLAPANPADLAALALDRLDELAQSIRHSNTNGWSFYWNQDGHARPTEPKPENACRDALLSGLLRRLPQEVDAQPEGQYAANRRADIRLSCSDFHVPIEIKKQSHPALWRAARDQLVAKYTQDPATGGYGIFLVLWFGEPEKTPLDETGTRPASPEELQQRLEACIARQLAPDQARKIAVRVVDVSKP